MIFSGMKIIEANDVVCGNMATAFIKFEGRNEPCSYFTSINATMKKKKIEAPRLGTTSLMKRSAGWSGTGTVKLYYSRPFFRELAARYAKDGKDVFVDLYVTNEDPSSGVGRQAVVLKNVNFDDITIAKFDVNGSEPLSEEMRFTFDDFEILESFVQPGIVE